MPVEEFVSKRFSTKTVSFKYWDCIFQDRRHHPQAFLCEKLAGTWASHSKVLLKDVFSSH
jgi:hypothetical protein